MSIQLPAVKNAKPSPCGPAEQLDPRRYQKLAPRFSEKAFDLRELVPDCNEFELEIGFGRGASLLERARNNRSIALFGVEVKSKWVYKVHERACSEKLHNISVFCGDARKFLKLAGPDACLSRVFVHFPDPWWKKRHSKRRVIDAELLNDAHRVLKKGGDFFVQTDVQERAELYAATFRAHPNYALLEVDGSEWLTSNPFAAPSNRERRAELDGLPVYRFIAKAL
ncbi:MAG: tRNA (guanosine(46)-N7)-methyltransferase TrmB [Myxococcales bacterium]|nr:MAG: tRNA (guanosine(46)-N7)-methyltransferase TrmB [Myxococcales bacterium]